MVTVKKRRRIEEFVESKVRAGVEKAGATAEEAALVAKDISKKVARKTDIKAEELSDLVVRSIEKVNKKAAKEFVRFRDEKLKAKKKKKP